MISQKCHTKKNHTKGITNLCRQQTFISLSTIMLNVRTRSTAVFLTCTLLFMTSSTSVADIITSSERILELTNQEALLLDALQNHINAEYDNLKALSGWVKTLQNKKDSENADTSKSVIFDLVVWLWPFDKAKKAYVIRVRLMYCTLVEFRVTFDLRLWPSSYVKVTFIA